MTFAGTCLCGQFKWKAHGQPEFVGFCHCSHCRRLSGAGRSPFMGFQSDQVFTMGDSASFTDSSDSGEGIERHFCPTCGSRLFARPGSAEGYSIFYAGSLDTPALFAPQISVFTASAVQWDPPAESTEIHEKDVS